MKLATWNIGSALETESDNSIEYIVDYVEKNSIDILCLQEIITSGNKTDYISELQKKLSFNYSEFYELSSAHLNDESMFGIAIISRYKILNSYKINLTNPNITFNKNGKIIKSDDKGLLIVEVLYKGVIVKVATCHMLPFHSFGSDSSEYKHLYQEMYSKVKRFCNDVPFVLCGDFNSSKLQFIVQEIYNDMINVYNEPTRYNGSQNDYIFLSREWCCKSYWINMNKYDHFLCVCDIELETNDNLKILHLSDMHYLSNDYSIDQKTKLANVKESDIRERIFTKKISERTGILDYIIVSGDITTQGKKEGFEKFNKFVHLMQEKNIFPPSNHFIIVPGNHDVGSKNRWNEFLKLLDGNFVRPWIEDIDIKPQDLLDLFFIIFNKENASVFGFIEDEITLKKIHFPFILDINNHLLIYAFNSSSISKTNIILNEDDEKFINQIKSKKNNKETEQLLSILEKELEIDPARIDPQEIFLFEEFLKIIENKIDLSTFYKIAVLHHHITTISCSEEIKKFDNITNAGILKKTLSDKGFQLVMHGHKHSADVFYDSAIANHKKILVVSGGTVFGYSNNRENGFYLHTLKENIINSQYIFLNDDRNPNCTITKLNSDTHNKYGLTIKEIYKDVEQRVIQHINKETINDIEYIGWSKNIEDRKVGSISSVYGLLILETLRSENRYYTKNKEKLIKSLWQFRYTSGGWGAVSQITTSGAPEATAWVVLALFTMKSPLFEKALNDLYEILNRIGDNINSNFTLGLLITILCQVDPDSKFIPMYCEKLLNSAIREDGKIKYWASKYNDRLIRKIEPSIVHTACSIIALYNCQNRGIISIDLRKELANCREILLNRNLWKNTQEAISVQIGNKEDSLIVNYYTITWVLKALLTMDNFVDNSIIEEIINLILKDYKNGYWNYDNCYYIWAIYDAITALETYFYNR